MIPTYSCRVSTTQCSRASWWCWWTLVIWRILLAMSWMSFIMTLNLEGGREGVREGRREGERGREEEREGRKGGREEGEEREGKKGEKGGREGEGKWREGWEKKEGYPHFFPFLLSLFTLTSHSLSSSTLHSLSHLHCSPPPALQHSSGVSPCRRMTDHWRHRPGD